MTLLFKDINNEYSGGRMANRKYENLKSKKNSIICDTKKAISKFDKVADEAERVSGVAKSVAVIIADLDREFEQATKLTKVDINFLFFATALQCVRQYIITPFAERTTDKVSAKEAHAEEKQIFGKLFDEKESLTESKRYYASPAVRNKLYCFLLRNHSFYFFAVIHFFCFHHLFMHILWLV